MRKDRSYPVEDQDLFSVRIQGSQDGLGNKVRACFERDLHLGLVIGQMRVALRKTRGLNKSLRRHSLMEEKWIDSRYNPLHVNAENILAIKCLTVAGNVQML